MNFLRRLINGAAELDGDEDDDEDTTSEEGSDVDSDDAHSADKSNKSRREAFDPNVPETHAYLGELEDVAGATFLQAETFISVPLVIRENLIVVPGQTLPLHIYEPSQVRMIQQLLLGDKIFGVICAKHDGSIGNVGTTAEIISIKQDHDPIIGMTILSIKAVGRQRFILKSRHGSEHGVMMGDIVIIEDVHVHDPTKLYTKHRESWAITSTPKFIFKAYDCATLMSAVKERLSPWSIDLKLIPTEPSEFSFWVTSNLPLDDDVKLQLISLCCPTQRLRMILHLLEKCSTLRCVSCGSEISGTSSIFTMSVRGPMGTFVNSHGWVHQMFTVTTSQGYTLRGRRTEQDSWFPGYAWTIMECTNCSQHLGWQFTSVKHKLEPLRFFGLCRRSVQAAISNEEKRALPF